MVWKSGYHIFIWNQAVILLKHPTANRKRLDISKNSEEKGSETVASAQNFRLSIFFKFN